MRSKKPNPGRRLDRPFRELGDMLIALREKAHRSALSFYRAEKGSGLSFSYSSYVDFENGTQLPSAEFLAEIVARSTGKKPGQGGVEEKTLFFTWARVQMNDEALKDYFRLDSHPGDRRGKGTAKAVAAETLVPDRDNTWLFNERDRRILEKEPRLWELLMALTAIHPEPRALAAFETKKWPLPKLRRIIQPWIESGDLLLEGDKLSVRRPFLYLPKSKEWDKIRLGNFTRAMEEVATESARKEQHVQIHQRSLIYRTLDNVQAKRWLERLKDLVDEFEFEPYTHDPSSAEDPTHVLGVFFSHRPVVRKKP